MTTINSIGLKAIIYWSVGEEVRHPVPPSLNNDIRHLMEMGCSAIYGKAIIAQCKETVGTRCTPVLVDQGRADPFLEKELKTEWLEALKDDRLTLRWHAGYDHSYFFIASFMGEHLAFHARVLRG